MLCCVDCAGFRVKKVNSKTRPAQGMHEPYPIINFKDRKRMATKRVGYTCTVDVCRSYLYMSRAPPQKPISPYSWPRSHDGSGASCMARGMTDESVLKGFGAGIKWYSMSARWMLVWALNVYTLCNWVLDRGHEIGTVQTLYYRVQFGHDN